MLALTDHNYVTYPWSSYGRDPAALNMSDIQGNELSSGHHIVSLFSNYASSSSNETTLLTGVGAAGGIAFFAHPGRYSQSAQWYADHYLAQPHCIGQEIYNQGDRYTGDRAKWDAVLNLLMPARPVWGFSNDDSHQASHIGRNRTYLLMPSLSNANVRSALVNGAFYSTYSTSSAHTPPALTGVTVDETAGTIAITGTGYTEIRWISQGAQVATGATLDLVNTAGVAKYVRAELHGPEGIAYTNPFGLLPTGNQPPTVNAGPNQSVLLAAGATLDGRATDDGLPNLPGALTLLWEKVSGEGDVTFGDASAAQTTASFSAAGTYVLRLTADDGELSASATVTITVLAALPGIPVGATGSGILTFDTLPPAGEWATSAIGSGKDGFTTAAGLDAGVQALSHTAVSETLVSSTSSSPSKNQRAVWTSGGSRYIQLSATSVGAVLLKATLVNTSGSPLSSLRIAYNYTVVETTAEEVPGLRVFYSLTGAPNSWVLIPELSGSLVTQAYDVAVNLPSAWADDNAAADTERKYRIDNFSVTPENLPLAVNLTAPADGASIHRNYDVVLEAAPAGGTAPYTVQFFAALDGGVFAPVGTVSAAPWRVNLGPLAPGARQVFARVTDSGSATADSPARSFTVTDTLGPLSETWIAKGSVWKYLDNGSDQGTAWRAPVFDDSAWAQGAAPLGYGDSWMVTTVFSPPAPNRYITTYFRKTISVTDPDEITALNLGIQRDDGAVVYLNGTEVFRTNMPEGEINYLTFSSTIVSGADETTFFPGTVPTNLLAPGENVIAVEVHQRDGTSSDLTFDFELIATRQPVENQTPQVSAGADLIVTLPDAVTLNGSASDDGRPNPPGALTLLWEKISGEGDVTFDDATSAVTTATFSAAGTYVLQLTANDGARSASAQTTVTVQPASAPEPEAWAAYNDCVWQPAADKHENATTFNIGSGSPGPATGKLRDLDTGVELPVTVTMTQTGGVFWQPDPVTGGSDCAAGTDADQTFGNIVSMGGVIYYGAVGWTVEATFTGLDPNGVYEFATSANRNNPAYSNRRTVYTILGADAFHAAHTAGVIVDGASATFNTGDNTANGYVARWIGIRPGPDGSFTVRATHAPDAESGNKAYAFDVWMLRRVSGFDAFAQQRGYRGTDEDLGRDNGQGVPLGVEYAAGDNLRADEPLINIFERNGQVIVDVPAQADETRGDVQLVVQAAERLTDGPDGWTLPTEPAPDTAGKPAHRAWFIPSGAEIPASGFFRLQVERVNNLPP